MLVLTTALFVLVELLGVHLSNSRDFFGGHGAFAQWTRCVDHEPLLDASSVEIVADVAGKGSHERFLIKVQQADHARLLSLENVRVILGAEEGVDEVFGRVQSIVLMLMILIENVQDIWGTK